MGREMLADVLKQNEIPYLYKESLGAAVTIQTGSMLERYRFLCRSPIMKVLGILWKVCFRRNEKDVAEGSTLFGWI